ncbi:gamma-glutamylcyclotransferase family protein [Brevundimonas goettingensis]|uniref:Gamma-glutamylcyclotransferase n=1 Tax=Brevundimonas goettingensis TaxID=2774190 RepID=A0A975C2S0_9CAUL|nr:gamma-glutamylcyclotransferase family protein [Brevundimonas goettingensis]QTC90795.1 gamma-glutamylcyclotransferase [Brevundimonas goettingensis]
MTGVLLFAYGTLQDPAIQIAHFGRPLTGDPDRLDGFTRSTLTDGDAVYPVLIPGGPAPTPVEGVVFEITPADLAAADAYEGDLYRRIRVRLASEIEAWVYVAA